MNSTKLTCERPGYVAFVEFITRFGDSIRTPTGTVRFPEGITLLTAAPAPWRSNSWRRRPVVDSPGVVLYSPRRRVQVDGYVVHLSPRKPRCSGLS